MLRKIVLLSMVALLSAMLIAGCTSKQSAPKKELNVYVGTTKDQNYSVAGEEMAKIISEKTKGNITLKIHHGGTLAAGEREALEALKAGTIDMVITSAAPTAGFVTTMGIVSLPFLFRDYNHADKVFDGPIGDAMLKELEAAGFKGLAWWEDGFGYITNSVRPIKTPADLKGIKLRVMESPVLLYTFRDVMGSDAFPLSWSELYLALQRGVAQGQFNAPSVVYVHKFYEVQKYLSMVAPTYAPALVVMNLEKFKAMPQDIQKLFVDTAKSTAKMEREYGRKQNDDYVKKLETECNMTIVRDVDMKAWVEKAAAAHDKFAPDFGADRIKAIKDTR
jgi:tripartite ATP-independent transporter DctP family solute receptor